MEIELVLNDTDCFVTTRSGVGHHEFAGTLFIPTRAAIVLYQLYIFTCSRPHTKHRQHTINKAKELGPHRTTVFYRPDLYLSSSEDSDRTQKETRESLINYAPLDEEADRPKLLLGDAV